MKLMVIVSILLFESTLQSQSQKPQVPTTAEQSSFSLERPFERPVKVPNPVVHMLKSDSSVTTNLCGQQQPPDATLRSWLEAAEIHLAKKAEPALLIKGKSCLLGANEGPFWIFTRANEKEYQQILSVSALGIKVCRTKTNGYRNISAGAAIGGGTASFVLFKFDGEKYQLAESESTKECE